MFMLVVVMGGGGLIQKANKAAFMSFGCTLAKPTSFLRILRPPSVSSPRSAAAMSSAASDHTTSAPGNAAAGIHGDLDSLFKRKKIVRSKVKKALREMDPALRSVEDDAIQRIVLDAPWFKSTKRLCAYISCSALREVDTSKILNEILWNPTEDPQKPCTKALYVPRVEDKNSYMRMFNISSTEDLIANSMSILEPSPVDSDGNPREDVMHASEPVDLFLLPGLAFDKSGRRLGRGGGYYDTFLRNYQKLANERSWKQPLLVALSYSLQILDEDVIPVTADDVFIDALVTPAGVTPISRAALLRIKHET